jgi:hypothetical protein
MTWLPFNRGSQKTEGPAPTHNAHRRHVLRLLEQASRRRGVIEGKHDLPAARRPYGKSIQRARWVPLAAEIFEVSERPGLSPSMSYNCLTRFVVGIVTG